MGCSCHGGRVLIVNSTKYSLRVMIHKDEARGEEKIENIGFKGGAKGGGAGVGAEIGGQYNTKKKMKQAYVDQNFEGFVLIKPDTYYDFSSQVDTSVTHYVSIYVIYGYDKKSKPWRLAYKQPFIGDFRKLVGLIENETDEFHPDFIQLVNCNKNDMFRAEKKNGCQNYYYLRDCPGCKGKIGCKEDCLIQQVYDDYLEKEAEKKVQKIINQLKNKKYEGDDDGEEKKNEKKTKKKKDGDIEEEEEEEQPVKKSKSKSSGKECPMCDKKLVNNQMRMMMGVLCNNCMGRASPMYSCPTGHDYDMCSSCYKKK
jgi:hypothetical protein